MKRFALAFLILLNFGAQAAPKYLTDVHGEKHYFGYLGHKPGYDAAAKPRWQASPEFIASLPDNYDLRTLGFVAPIRDQKQCGSCWSHSLLKTFESSRLLHGSAYMDLSEQDEMMNGDGDNCNGGYMDGTHLVTHGSAHEADCPYVATARACSAAPADHGSTWAFIGPGNGPPSVDNLRAAIVAHGVITVDVAAGGVDWEGGNSGHMTDCSNKGTNHMVNLVGFTKNADGSFTFIGANSWGQGWGDKGFFYAKAGCDQLANEALFIDASGTPGPTPPGPTPPPPGTCTKAAPSITLTPAKALVGWRGASYTATILNNNSGAGCGNSTITVTTQAATLTLAANPGTLTLAPGAIGGATITATLPSGSRARGAYTVKVTAADSVSGAAASATATAVVQRR